MTHGVAVRVVIVDDHELVRAGLRAVLAEDDDIQVVASAPNANEALRVVERVQPDVVVVDIRLPGMSGIELCERLKASWPDLAVIVLTSFTEADVHKRARNAGASAVVHKGVDASGLADAIRAAVNPETRGEYAPGRAPRGVLSGREIDVLRLVAAGATNKDVANELGLRLNTVKTYIQRVLDKLECHTRSEAAAIAMKRGLL